MTRARPAKRGSSIEVDWGELAPLRLRARTVAEGVYAGMHRSVRRGAGVEFGGQRPYVPGDDLRFFDKRSLLRHDRLMVREFETETDRALWLVVDATLSMGFRGGGKASKYAYAALLAAALARVALASGDPVGLVVLGGEGVPPVAASASNETFDRIVFALEAGRVAGDWSERGLELRRALVPIHERARRGATIVLLSDLIDLPAGATSDIGALATRGRRAYAVMVLSPEEADLPFSEHARFKSLEGGVIVDADPAAVREAYLENLRQHRDAWARDLVGRGGSLVSATTSREPVPVVRELLLAVRGVPVSGGAARGATEPTP